MCALPLVLVSTRASVTELWRRPERKPLLLSVYVLHPVSNINILFHDVATTMGQAAFTKGIIILLSN